MVEADKLKRYNYDEFEEDLASIESRERNKELKKEFEEVYKTNCKISGRKLSTKQNTQIFVSGTITRLLLPPRTHHSDCLKRISANMYVQVKK